MTLLGRKLLVIGDMDRIFSLDGVDLKSGVRCNLLGGYSPLVGFVTGAGACMISCDTEVGAGRVPVVATILSAMPSSASVDMVDFVSGSCICLWRWQLHPPLGVAGFLDIPRIP